MIPSLRTQFNANFTPEKYQTFLKVMKERCGTAVQFRMAETPCFFPQALLDQMSEYGKELIHQLESLEYRKQSFHAIPPEFKVPHEAPHPMFIQVDFGLVRDAEGGLQPKLVEGATITQAYQFVETGNAELGFVALSQLTGHDNGSRWLVPQELYSPIRQDAVLMKSGALNEAATGFMAFLRSPQARAIIEKYGYVLDGQS